MKLRTKVTPPYPLTLSFTGTGLLLCFPQLLFTKYTQPFGLHTLLVPLVAWLLSLLLASSSLLFLSCSTPALFFWTGSVWTLPEGSGCALSHISNKMFSLAIPGSSYAIIFFHLRLLKDSCRETEGRKRGFV